MDDMPLTPGDLRDIADAIERVEATDLADVPLLGRIELYRPDCDDLIGWVTRFDESSPELGWGFLPGTETP